MSNNRNKPTVEARSEDVGKQEPNLILTSIDEEDAPELNTYRKAENRPTVGVRSKDQAKPHGVRDHREVAAGGNRGMVTHPESSPSDFIQPDISLEKYDHRKMSNKELEDDLRRSSDCSLEPPILHGHQTSIIEVINEADVPKNALSCAHVHHRASVGSNSTLPQEVIINDTLIEDHTSSTNSRFISSVEISLNVNEPTSDRYSVKDVVASLEQKLADRASREEVVSKTLRKAQDYNVFEKSVDADFHFDPDHSSATALSEGHRVKELVDSWEQKIEDREAPEEISRNSHCRLSSVENIKEDNPFEHNTSSSVPSSEDADTCEEEKTVDGGSSEEVAPRASGLWQGVSAFIKKFNNWQLKKEGISPSTERKSSEHLRAEEIYQKRMSAGSVASEGERDNNSSPTNNDEPQDGSFKWRKMTLANLKDVLNSELFPPNRKIRVKKYMVAPLVLSGAAGTMGGYILWQYATNNWVYLA